jgi:hypothetical protein
MDLILKKQGGMSGRMRRLSISIGRNKRSLMRKTRIQRVNMKRKKKKNRKITSRIRFPKEITKKVLPLSYLILPIKNLI